MNGGIIGLVGPQGVGKSSALLAIVAKRMLLQNEEYRKKHKSGHDPNLGRDMTHFKWRRYSELIPSLLNGTHELSKAFRYVYSETLIAHLENNLRLPYFLQSKLEEVKKHPATLNLHWAEKKIGRSQANSLREQVWRQLVLANKLVLIDTQGVYICICIFMP
jgi:ATPase subunit of ABC transporter with duplicated ATPase domains